MNGLGFEKEEKLLEMEYEPLEYLNANGSRISLL